MRNKHLQSEREIWLSTLDHMRQENVFFKNNLANIIKKDIDLQMLGQAEQFQSIFINKDAVIALLRYDIAVQNKYAGYGDELPENLAIIIVRQDKTRRDIAVMEQEFRLLKILFDEYMSKAAG